MNRAMKQVCSEWMYSQIHHLTPFEAYQRFKELQSSSITAQTYKALERDLGSITAKTLSDIFKQ